MVIKKKRFLMLSHPLTNFEIQNYYQNESRFNGVFSRDDLRKKIKDGAYVVNLDQYAHMVQTGLIYFVKEVKLFIL